MAVMAVMAVPWDFTQARITCQIAKVPQLNMLVFWSMCPSPNIKQILDQGIRPSLWCHVSREPDDPPVSCPYVGWLCNYSVILSMRLVAKEGLLKKSVVNIKESIFDCV